MRNLVVFCDGTNNLWGEGRDTNVVKLARVSQVCDAQLVYYDPGVGSNDGLPLLDPFEIVRYRINRVLGFAVARGIYPQIAEAYAFLCTHYRPGDRIFLFGFSRGAFAARSIGGLINTFGLVQPSMTPLIGRMVQLYFSAPGSAAPGKPAREQIVADIRASFVPPGRSPEVHFIGVWDTVESVGIASDLHIANSPSIRGKRFRHVRHAVALHECRQQYRPRLYAEDTDPHQTLEQRWFAGVHSDVGGSYPEAGLANCALQWVARAAIAQGLRVDTRRLREYRGDALGPAHDQSFRQPVWALAGLAERPAPPLRAVHPSARHRARVREQLRADPELHVTWQALWRRRGFWIALALSALFMAMVGAVEAGMCPRVAGDGSQCESWRLISGTTGLFGDAYRRLFDGVDMTRLGWLLLGDALFLPAYVVLFAFLSAHAQRRLYAWARTPEQQRALGRLGMAPLWYVPGFDALENLSLAIGRADTVRPMLLADVFIWLAPWFGVMKFVALSLLAGLVVWSWIAGRPVSTSRLD